jgi:hypothetical protein
MAAALERLPVVLRGRYIREGATAMIWARFLDSSVPVHAAIAMV